MTALLVLGALILLYFAIANYVAGTAPEGWEDRDGWHQGRKP